MKKREQHRESKTILFKRWSSMRNRVSPKWKTRQYYYDKGIGICKEWDSFLVFKEWSLKNGFDPKLELDRIDNNKGYSPENCRWTTKRINNHNKDNTVRVNINGEINPLTFVCEDLGFDYTRMEAVRHRIVRGWDAEKAINEPVKSQFNRKRKDYRVIDTVTNEIYNNPKEVYEKYNFIESTFRSRLNGILKNNTRFKYLVD